MNLFRNQTYVTKEIIDGWSLESKTLDEYIKTELFLNFFDANPNMLHGGAISYYFKIFDCNSESTPENEKYHGIIKQCKSDQTRYYEIVVYYNPLII